MNKYELLNSYLKNIKKLKEDWELGIQVINDCDNYWDNFFELNDKDRCYILNYLDDYLNFKNVQKDILNKINNNLEKE